MFVGVIWLIALEYENNKTPLPHVETNLSNNFNTQHFNNPSTDDNNAINNILQDDSGPNPGIRLDSNIVPEDSGSNLQVKSSSEQSLNSEQEFSISESFNYSDNYLVNQLFQDKKVNSFYFLQLFRSSSTF